MPTDKRIKTILAVDDSSSILRLTEVTDNADLHGWYAQVSSIKGIARLSMIFLEFI